MNQDEKNYPEIKVKDGYTPVDILSVEGQAVSRLCNSSSFSTPDFSMDAVSARIEKSLPLQKTTFPFTRCYVGVKGKWEDYFLKIAEVVASRSSCTRRKVGAVIVRDHYILATGYNGTPKGLPNCDEGGCPRCAGNAPSGTSLTECLCSHAEENAIVQAAYHGTAIVGGEIYCTITPCIHCAKMIINAGLVRVVCSNWYQKPKMLTEDPVFEMFMHAGIDYIFPDFSHDKEN